MRGNDWICIFSQIVIVTQHFVTWLFPLPQEVVKSEVSSGDKEEEETAYHVKKQIAGMSLQTHFKTRHFLN